MNLEVSTAPKLSDKRTPIRGMLPTHTCNTTVQVGGKDSARGPIKEKPVPGMMAPLRSIIPQIIYRVGDEVALLQLK